MLDRLFSILVSLLEWAIQALPYSEGLSANVTNALNTLLGYVAAVSYFFPLGTLVFLSVLTIAVHKAQLIWAGVNWIIRKIPGMQ